MAYVQYSNLDNETFRNSFVMNALSSTIAKSKSKNRLLDVGAGLAPYREHARRSGFVYQSHDFKQYIPKQSGSGLHNTEWEYPQHDFVCDILEIPYKESWDFIL